MASPGHLTTNTGLPMQALQKPAWRSGRKSLGQGRKGGGQEQSLGLTWQEASDCRKGSWTVLYKVETRFDWKSRLWNNEKQTQCSHTEFGPYRWAEKGNIEAMFGTGIQNETRLDKIYHTEISLKKNRQVEGPTTQKEWESLVMRLKASERANQKCRAGRRLQNIMKSGKVRRKLTSSVI